MNKVIPKLQYCLAIIILSFLVGCSLEVAEPTLDTSSKAAYFASVKAMKKTLNPEQLAQLDAALKYLVRIDAQDGNFQQMVPKGTSPDQFGGAVMKVLHQKTFTEVLSLNREIQLSEDRKHLEMIKPRVEELEKEEQKYAQTKGILSKILLEDVRFYWKEFPPGIMIPVVDAVATNNTGNDLLKIVLQGIVTTKDKDTPWINAELRATILGGLKDGETRQIKLQAPPYSEFARAPLRDRNDTDIKLTVINAIDSEDKYLAHTLFLDDKKELDRLRKKVAELEQRIAKAEM